MGSIFFQGEFVPAEEAKISVMTHAFLYGTSVFEGIRAYWNTSANKLYMFRPTEHFQRLHQSCKILRMQLNHSPTELVELARTLINKHHYQEDIYIRPIVYKADQKIGPSLLNTKDDFCMFVLPMGDYIDTQKAISVCTSSWRRIDDNTIPARAKVAGGYVNTALAKSTAQLSGFADTVMLDNDGHVCEGSAMNIFVVRNGEFITSPITANILEGITRDTLIELLQEELGLPVTERPIDRTELYLADEVFFCGTGAQISAIGAIDHYAVGNGQIGPHTRRLQELYFQIVKAEHPKYKDRWCVAV